MARISNADLSKSRRRLALYSFFRETADRGIPSLVSCGRSNSPRSWQRLGTAVAD
jgi:hypothetical protein